MKITVVAVTGRHPSWVDAGSSDYCQRLPADFTVKFVEIDTAPRRKTSTTSQCLQDEAKRIRQAIPKQAYVIALAINGKRFSSEQLASEIRQLDQHGRELCLLIGGPDGLDPELIAEADTRWSLSDLTFPHPLVKLLLSEQLYRAWSILSGRKYHK